MLKDLSKKLFPFEHPAEVALKNMQAGVQNMVEHPGDVSPVRQVRHAVAVARFFAVPDTDVNTQFVISHPKDDQVNVLENLLNKGFSLDDFNIKRG